MSEDRRPPRRNPNDRPPGRSNAGTSSSRPPRRDADVGSTNRTSQRNRTDEEVPVRREREQVWHHKDAGEQKPMFGGPTRPRLNRNDGEKSSRMVGTSYERGFRNGDKAHVRLDSAQEKRLDNDHHTQSKFTPENSENRRSQREHAGDLVRSSGHETIGPSNRDHFRERKTNRAEFRENNPGREEAQNFRPRRQELTPRSETSFDNGDQPRYRDEEIRLYGVNACRAVFEKRPHDIRKVFIDRNRLDAFTDILSFCAAQKLGYTLVEPWELPKIAQTDHHEGVCFAVKNHPRVYFDSLLQMLTDVSKPTVLLFLDGVGNPHNLGAILRSAAHFGALAILVQDRNSVALSPSACRVAEGAAEHIPLVTIADLNEALSKLRELEFKVVATALRKSNSIYSIKLPNRVVIVVGNEGSGISQDLLKVSDLTINIPGSGLVESLNVAHATSVVLAEWWRQNLK